MKDGRTKDPKAKGRKHSSNLVCCLLLGEICYQRLRNINVFVNNALNY
jgi:hypothetical protein